MENQLQKREGILRIDVVGKSPDTWSSLRSKLLAAIGKVLDSVIDPEHGTTVREEAKKFTSALLDHARARLAKAGLENEKIEAEVAKLYAECESISADARKKHAEAEATEFETAVKRLKLALELTKAMLIGEPGEEAIVFGNQVQALLGVLSEAAQA